MFSFQRGGGARTGCLQTGDTRYCVLESLASKSGFASVRQKRQPGELKSASLFPENTLELYLYLLCNQPKTAKEERNQTEQFAVLYPRPCTVKTSKARQPACGAPFRFLYCRYILNIYAHCRDARAMYVGLSSFLISHEKEKGRETDNKDLETG